VLVGSENTLQYRFLQKTLLEVSLVFELVMGSLVTVGVFN
jgi:hypothetical protein